MSKSDEILVEVTRGDVVECVHRGHFVVTDVEGDIMTSRGDPDHVTYMRSATKPVQAMMVILSGAARRFDFSPAELAVMCASHYGEPFHVAAVRSILDKIGLNLDHLMCGPATSLKNEYAFELARQGKIPAPVYSDCSGKHAGMLAVCVQLGYPLDDYLSPLHPLQIEIKKLLARMAGIPVETIAVGIDGCSAPVFALPLSGMARVYARLADPSSIRGDVSEAVENIWQAMNAHPEMIAGTGGFCTELMKHTGGKVLAKLGAEGMYCVGLRSKQQGLALKVSDGGYRAIWPSVMEILRRMDVFDQMEYERLQAFHFAPNLNDSGEKTGLIRPAFSCDDLHWSTS